MYLSTLVLLVLWLPATLFAKCVRKVTSSTLAPFNKQLSLLAATLLRTSARLPTRDVSHFHSAARTQVLLARVFFSSGRLHLRCKLCCSSCKAACSDLEQCFLLLELSRALTSQRRARSPCPNKPKNAAQV